LAPRSNSGASTTTPSARIARSTTGRRKRSATLPAATCRLRRGLPPPSSWARRNVMLAIVPATGERAGSKSTKSELTDPSRGSGQQVVADSRRDRASIADRSLVGRGGCPKHRSIRELEQLVDFVVFRRRDGNRRRRRQFGARRRRQ